MIRAFAVVMVMGLVWLALEMLCAFLAVRRRLRQMPASPLISSLSPDATPEEEREVMDRIAQIEGNN